MYITVTKVNAGGVDSVDLNLRDHRPHGGTVNGLR